MPALFICAMIIFIIGIAAVIFGLTMCRSAALADKATKEAFDREFKKGECDHVRKI